jgi:hypothetical protein
MFAVVSTAVSLYPLNISNEIKGVTVLSILLSMVFSVVSFSVPSAEAYLSNAMLPVCLNGPERLPIDNAKILKLKATTRNQYLDRGFVRGKVVEAPTQVNDHDHFLISIGPGPKDLLEIIYNKDFGSMPNIRVGDDVVACGDYITANQSTGRYPASPAGAILHWVHFNPGTRAGSATHAHGFVMVGTNLIGFDDAPPGSWDGRIIKTGQPTGNVSNPSAPTPTTRVQTPNRRPSTGNSSGRPKNYPKRWKACSSLDECRARNGADSF